MFELVTKTVTVCTICKDQYQPRPSTETSLVISCENNDSIKRALDQYFARVDVVEVQCDSTTCKNAHRTKRKGTTILRAPEILCIQINRFKQVGPEKWIKDMSHVGYEEKLDLTDFLDSKDGTTLKYRLVTAVHHLGEKNSGHYITVAKTPGGDKWVRHDDHHVATFNLKEALEPKGEWTPYLLFWQQIKSGTPESPGKRPRPDENENDFNKPPSPKRQQKDNNSISPANWWERFLLGILKPLGTPSVLSDCEKEKEDLKALVNLAARAHVRLVDSAQRLNAGLDIANNMLGTYRPLMQELKGLKKYRAQAS
ncbi:MAG: hypothetical protein Q9221_001845 [Calogaya cf. arnoldii]